MKSRDVVDRDMIIDWPKDMKLGIELTYIHSKYTLQELDTAFIKNRLKVYEKIHFDSGAIEIPTPPFNSADELVDWYTRFLPIKEEFELEATWDRFYKNSTNNTWVGSGGGHITVSIPFNKSNVLFHVFIGRAIALITNHPEMVWMFNEYLDDSNANIPSYFTNSCTTLDAFELESLKYLWTITRYTEEVIRRYNFDLEHNDHLLREVKRAVNKYIDMHLDCSKSWAIAYKPDINALEFRFFDAPKTFLQLSEHINFLARVINVILPQNCLPEKLRECRFISKIGAQSVSTYIENFKTLIDVLDLDWKAYKKYTKNLKDRVECGVKLI